MVKRSDFHQNLRFVFIRERNYVNNGLNQISTLKQVGELYLVVSAFFVLYKVEVPHLILAPLTLVFILALRTIGWLYDKAHLYEEEAEFGNRRNPAIQTLLRKGRFK